MSDSQTTLDVEAGSDWQDTAYGWFNQAWAKIDNEYVRLSGNPASQLALPFALGRLEAK